MLKYIHGEIYRLLRKKSMYIYFGMLAVGYILITYIRSSGFTPESILNDAYTIFGFLPVLVGGFLFAAIYTDDLSSKNLIPLVGFGLRRITIVISKLILMALFGTIIFGLAPLLHIVVYSVLGFPATSNVWMMIYATSLEYLLTTLAFAALAGVAVYGLQRTTFAIVLYLLLALNIISQLLVMMLGSHVPNLTNYMIGSITDRIFNAITDSGSLTLPVIGFVTYVLIALVLTTLAFNKKEMEF